MKQRKRVQICIRNPQKENAFLILETKMLMVHYPELRIEGDAIIGDANAPLTTHFEGKQYEVKGSLGMLYIVKGE